MTPLNVYRDWSVDASRSASALLQPLHEHETRLGRQLHSSVAFVKRRRGETGNGEGLAVAASTRETQVDL